MVKAPGKPRRLQPYPLYEVNLTKDGILFCENASPRASTLFAPKDGISKMEVVCSGTHNLFTQIQSNESTRSSEEADNQEEIETAALKQISSPSTPTVTTVTHSPPFPVSPMELKAILQALPPRFHYYHWSVVYDTTRHGCSLHHFYRMMNHIYYSEAGGIGLFLVRQRLDRKGHEVAPSTLIDSSPLDPKVSMTSNGSFSKKGTEGEVHPIADGGEGGVTGIIGCFTPTVPCEQLIGIPHAGSPETFIFSLDERPEENTSMPTSMSSMWNSFRRAKEIRFHPSPTSSTPNRGHDRRLRVHRWGKEASAHNRFMRCQHDGMSFGGGEHGPALWVDHQLEKGTSSRFCQTFRSPPLFGVISHSLSHTEFQIERMVWLAMNTRHALHAASSSGEMPEALLRNEESVWSSFMKDPSRLQQQIVHE